MLCYIRKWLSKRKIYFYLFRWIFHKSTTIYVKHWSDKKIIFCWSSFLSMMLSLDVFCIKLMEGPCLPLQLVHLSHCSLLTSSQMCPAFGSITFLFAIATHPESVFTVKNSKTIFSENSVYTDCPGEHLREWCTLFLATEIRTADVVKAQLCEKKNPVIKIWCWRYPV